MSPSRRVDPVLRSADAHVAVASVDAPDLDAETEHHLRVLRLRAGATVTVTDGAGSWRECHLAGPGRLDAVGEVRREPAAEVFHLYCALPKQNRPELIVQKVTELGVYELTWIDCRRSVVRWDEDRARRQLERHRRIALEAALQSRRVWFPIVSGVRDAADVLADVAVADPDGEPWSAAISAIAIGPEGGWSPEERAMAAGAVALGPNVLRVETAAIAATALAQAVR